MNLARSDQEVDWSRSRIGRKEETLRPRHICGVTCATGL